MVNAITPVGTASHAVGSGLTTLSVTPSAVGDCLVFATIVGSGLVSVASVAGGGVTTWTRLTGPYVDTPESLTFDLWLGTVTASGAATITVTGSGSLAGKNIWLLSQQFTGGGAGTVWAVDGAQAGGLTNASSAAVTYPPLTPGGASRCYVGRAFVANSGSLTGQTAGYTLQNDASTNPFIYNTSVSTAQAPASVQSPAGISGGVGALITASSPAVTVFDRPRAVLGGNPGQSLLIGRVLLDRPGCGRVASGRETLVVDRVLADRPSAVLPVGVTQAVAAGAVVTDRPSSITARSPGQTLAIDRFVVDRPGGATAASVSQALAVGRALADRPTSVLGSTPAAGLTVDRSAADRPTPALAGGPLGEQISAVTPVVVVDRSSAVIAISRGQSLVVDRLLADAPSAIRASSPASSLAVDRFVTDRSSAIRTGGGAQQVVVGVAAVDRSGATAAAGPSQALVTDRLLADRPGSVAAGAPGQTGQVDTVRADRPGSMSATRPGQVVLVDVIRQDRPGPATAAGPATGLAYDVALADRPWHLLAASCDQNVVLVEVIPEPTAGWPPVFAGPSPARLVMVAGPELAPLVLVSTSTPAPLVLISGHVPAPSPGSTPHPVMARRGLSRRSLPGPADEFVIEQFRALRERRRAAKIRGANQ